MCGITDRVVRLLGRGVGDPKAVAIHARGVQAIPCEHRIEYVTTRWVVDLEEHARAGGPGGVHHRCYLFDYRP